METCLNENWEMAKERFAAFWQRQIVDRPCLQMAVRQGPGPVRYLAEAFPVTYIQKGGLAAMMGCAQEIAPNTVWTRPCCESLDGLDIRVDRASPVLREMIGAIEDAARRDAGKCMVSFPANMGNVGDTLAMMRGYEGLCLDLAADPDRVAQLEGQVLQCWRELYDLFYGLTQPHIPGSVTQWLPAYHAGRCTLIEADFIAMISPEHFAKVYLPVIRERTRWVERSMLHLDGPGSARHLDAILEIPGLDAIQWEPGAGSGSRLRWIDLLRKIQSRGKGLWVACKVDEAREMLDSLSPRGLILSVLDCDSVETARRIEQLAAHRAATA